jgi:hypothetical protein
MRSFCFSLFLSVALLGGVFSSTAPAATTTGINKYAGKYSGYFYIQLNSGDYLPYNILFTVKSGPAGAASLVVTGFVASGNVQNYLQGQVNGIGTFNVVMIPGQPSSKLRNLSLGGKMRSKLNNTAGSGSFQFINPGNNLSNKLEAKTQGGLISQITKFSN